MKLVEEPCRRKAKRGGFGFGDTLKECMTVIIKSLWWCAIVFLICSGGNIFVQCVKQLFMTGADRSFLLPE
ncbi:MAG TPA: hypothetical protein DEO95_08400 [Ruminococcaceae bacterium]|nr:hypothetical protein [Oscillospiraceae bacterium]